MSSKDKSKQTQDSPGLSNTHSNTSSNSDLDSWKHRPPYAIHEPDENFQTRWTGRCHCSKVRFQISRQKPLNSKYCHCTTCQRLHGAPFQWASIFHKTDINFTHGHHDLVWYDPGECTTRHKLPCKVSCAYCRTPIMDEGRNMILLYPTLIDGVGGNEDVEIEIDADGDGDGNGAGAAGKKKKKTVKGRDVFKPSCHMFYGRRVVDLKDGVDKWQGLDGKSKRMDEDGNVVDEDEADDGAGMRHDGGGHENKRVKTEAGTGQ